MENKEKSKIIFAKEIIFIFKSLFISLIATLLFLSANYFYYIPEHDKYIERKREWDINEDLRHKESNKQNMIAFENALKEYYKKTDKICNNKINKELAKINKRLKEEGSLDSLDIFKPDYSSLLSREPMPKLQYEYKLQYPSYENDLKLSTNIWIISMKRNPIDNFLPIFLFSCALFIGWKYIFYILKYTLRNLLICYKWIIKTSKKEM